MGMLLGSGLILIPLLITPGILFYFDITPKVIVLLIVTAVALPLSAVRGHLALPWGFREGRRLFVVFLAQLLVLVTSTAFSTHPAISIGGTNWRRFGLVPHAAAILFAAVVCAELCAQPQLLVRLLRVISVSGLLAALYGIAQYLGWDPLLPSAAYHVGEGATMIVRPPGTVGYANYFATYLLAVVFCGTGLAIGKSTRLWRWVGALAAVSGSVALTFTGTRAAIIGLAGGAVVLALWFRPALRVVVAVVIAIALGGTGFYYSSAGAPLRSRARWFVEDPFGGARLPLWRDSARMAAARPAFGYGPETFSSEFPRYQSRELARSLPSFYQESPHNIFLDALVEQGVPGLITLAALLFIGLGAALRNRTAVPEIAGGLAAALIAVAVSQLFTAFVLVTAVFTYTLVAMAVALRCEFRPRPTHPGVVVTVPIALTLVTFAATLLVSDRSLVLVNRALERSAPTEAADHYGRARRWLPCTASSDIWYSRRMLLFAQNAPNPALTLAAWKEAMTAAVRAPSTAEDRHNALYNVAAFYAATNDAAHTEVCLRDAIRSAPNWFKPHWALARLLYMEGRRDEAHREARLAADLNGGHDPEVSLTLRQMENHDQR